MPSHPQLLRMAQQRSPKDYTVAIICALEIELRAVRGMLDIVHPRLRLSPESGDTNMYTCGGIHGHNIVACCLPCQTGKGSAAAVATNLARTFTAIKWRFIVGIRGGIPSDKHPVRLGDVVVGMPHGDRGGVVQYDLGKKTTDGFILTGFLCPPPAYLRNAAISMQTDYKFDGDNRIAEHIATLLTRYPRLVEFARPETSEVDVGIQIHYGLIASGDSVIKSKSRRDELVKLCGDVLCVEMEAAGISTAYECIVIRSISDLADENKNDEWQCSK